MTLKANIGFFNIFDQNYIFGVGIFHDVGTYSVLLYFFFIFERFFNASVIDFRQNVLTL